MKITNGKTVTIECTCFKDETHNAVNSDRHTITYLHGGGDVILELQNALEGKEPGDTVNLSLESDCTEEETLILSRSQFITPGEIQIGLKFTLDTCRGREVLTVTAIEGDSITVRNEKPQDKKTLRYSIKVLEVAEN